MMHWLRERLAIEAVRPVNCGREGYSTADATGWLQGLAGGRLVIDERSFEGQCPARRGLELGSPLPYGFTAGGPGSELGVTMCAFEKLDLSGLDGVKRAESLGVRFVLHTASHAPKPDAAWRLLRAQGETRLSERASGTAFIGAGCITERWHGSTSALRQMLFDLVAGEASLLATPTELVELVEGEGPVVIEKVARSGCDASAAEVKETPRERGVYEAVIRSPSDVDVVVRATYVPTWTVQIDGAVVGTKRIAPGFVGVRVPKGEHRIEAVVALPDEYVLGVIAAFVVAIGIGVISARWSAGR
jgi:hypothetical protein